MRKKLADLLADIRNARIGIVGDFCLDVYLSIDPSAAEVSVETGLPTHPVREQRYSPGGAGNVAANLAALRVKSIYAFGVTGEDPFGGKLRELLGALGVDCAGLLAQAQDWQTSAYVTPYEGDREGNRLDFGNFNALEEATGRALLEALERRAGTLDILIVNQQLYRGIHTDFFRAALADLLARHPRLPRLVDSRRYSDAYPGAMRKLNDREAARLCGLEIEEGEPVGFPEARRIAGELYRRWGRPLFLTRGQHGCIVFDAEGVREIPGLLILGPIDPVGAGDSMLAGIAAALAAGESPAGAAELGNFAAGVTVQKLRQTGTASPEEILAIGADPDYHYRPEIAREPRRARYYRDTEIEIVSGAFEPAGSGRAGRPGIRHAVFDHDGTLSTIRQGWEEVMEPMMIRAILGSRPEEADPAVYRRAAARVREYIEKTTGVQTLVQMRGLAVMVREAGLVPPGRILDEHGYKAMFNEALMERVDRRLAKLRRGELEVADCTLKGAVAFLQALHGRGVRLYLASGTDQADAEREARELGYAGLFGGRIYGAIGDIDHEPKKLVLDRILADIGRKMASSPQGGGEVCTFGDGPVEIRETHKRGGLTVGVASDEVRRYGLNPAKRSRLVQAGADLIVPDFSQADRLLELLFG
jgi:bifunctional ADP-heptose synthase (sugar kinase/adenylyltransferase)/phosphoglycolate phosphatase-like HAD superfamily hydrolase